MFEFFTLNAAHAAFKTKGFFNMWPNISKKTYMNKQFSGVVDWALS